MKKKILGVALIAAMAVAAGWNFNQSKNEVELSDLALANVEALASGEYPEISGWNNYIVYKSWNGGGIQTTCTSGGSNVCV